MMWPVKISYIINQEEIQEAYERIDRFGEGSAQIPKPKYNWGDGGLELDSICYWYIVDGNQGKEIRVYLRSGDHIYIKYDRDLLEELKRIYYCEPSE